jgi:Fur family transcriptional regulator, peroxide stress response regulator
MERKLKEKKIKITPQRLELTRILEELNETHPSFNDIYKAMKAIHPNVSRSTVHENLKLLVELGIIQSFHYKGEVRYEMDPEPHVNLAEPSGTIRDIKNHEIKKHLEEIERIMKEENYKKEKKYIKIKTLLVLVE